MPQNATFFLKTLHSKSILHFLGLLLSPIVLGQIRKWRRIYFSKYSILGWTNWSNKVQLTVVWHLFVLLECRVLYRCFNPVIGKRDISRTFWYAWESDNGRLMLNWRGSETGNKVGKLREGRRILFSPFIYRKIYRHWCLRVGTYPGLKYNLHSSFCYPFAIQGPLNSPTLLQPILPLFPNKSITCCQQQLIPIASIKVMLWGTDSFLLHKVTGEQVPTVGNNWPLAAKYCRTGQIDPLDNMLSLS